MRKFGFVRSLVLIAIILLGLCFAAQSFGTMGKDVSDSTAMTASQSQATTPISVDWAVAGLVVSGVLIILIRPRRRTQVAIEEEKHK